MLIRATRRNDEYEFKNGKKIFIDITYEEEKHAATECEVVSAPDKLFYSTDKNRRHRSTNFDTDVEIQRGDKVFIHYLATITAIQDKKSITDDQGSIYYFIKYHDLFAATRGEEVIMLNGYIAVEPVKDENYQLDGIIIVPDSLRQKNSERIGRVKFVGSKLRGYQFTPNSCDDNYDVNPGDLIAYTKDSDISMQYDIHRSFQGGDNLFRMQRRDIMYLC